MPIEDPRREKKSPPGFRTRHAPCKHGLEVRIVARKMEDGFADDHIRARVAEGHVFDGFDSEVRLRKRGREHSGEGADAFHRLHVRVNGVNFVAFPQEVDEVSAGTASGIQDSRSG